MAGVERGRGRGNLGTREGESASRTPKFPLPLPLSATLATQASNKIARFFFMVGRRRNMIAIQLFLQQSRKKSRTFVLQYNKNKAH